jgi:hypothetical protein
MIESSEPEFVNLWKNRGSQMKKKIVIEFLGKAARKIAETKKIKCGPDFSVGVCDSDEPACSKVE